MEESDTNGGSYEGEGGGSLKRTLNRVILGISPKRKKKTVKVDT